MKLIFYILFFFLHFFYSTNNLFSQCTQGAVTTFQKVIGGSGDERGHAVQQTSDGGYVVVGETTSYGAGNKDLFVLKLDANGVEQWTKTYGTSSLDDGNSISITQTLDGGFLLAGHTNGNNGYMIKIDGIGNIQWDKTVPNSTFRDVKELSSGDFILTGNDYVLGPGSINCFVVKITAAGVVLWSKAYGASLVEQATSIMELSNGDIIIGIHTSSYGSGTLSASLLRIDNLGNIVWQKYYGNGYDAYYSTKQLSDGNIIAVGMTSTFGVGSDDILLSKIDLTGNVIWTKTYGGISIDRGEGVMENQNGEIIIAGYTNSFGNGGFDKILLSVDNIGVINWSKAYGGNLNDEVDRWAKPFDLTTDEGMIIVGGTYSFSGSGEDIYLTKTNECGLSFCNEQSINLLVTTPNMFVGNTFYSVVSGGSFSPANSLSSPISFSSNFLCVDTVLTILPCNLTANFSATNNCIGDSAFFTDLSTDSLGNIINWQWYFGDGDSLTGVQNATHLYASSGTFNVTLVVTNDSNCMDSITLPIMVNPTYNINQTQSICQGDSMFLGGSFQNTAGIYTDSLQTAFGCDSIITTNLTVNPTFSSIQNLIICQGDSVLFGGIYYATQGIYTDSLQTQLGCDSLLKLNLTVNPSFQINQTLSICQGDSLFLGGSFQNTSGVYTDSLLTVFGCDSLLITNLTVGNNYMNSIAISICQGDSIFLGGSFQNTAGIYTDSLQTIFGCDSIVTTNLIVSSNPVIIASNDTTINACSSAQISATGGATYSWLPITDISCINCANPIASPLITTTYVVTGTVNGCSSKDTVIVHVEGESELIIPNVFTPNFDGINDGFNLIGGCIISVDKKIFNRWGQLLFHSNQIEEVWDGRTTAGENVPEGTYFYIFIIDQFENGNETQKTFKGTVSLLR